MPSIVENGDELQQRKYSEVLAKIDDLILPQTELKRPYINARNAHVAEWLSTLEMDKRLSELSIIHVAGTKGKGSTCAMVDHILQACGYTTGRFTSPHLFDVRERICLSGKWVDKTVFQNEAEWCFSKLEKSESPMPPFFRFMTLLAFRVFLQAKVDVVILEVGLGGRLDATNIIRAPVVCGVTMLGFDHMEVLGYTLGEISREKGGIFKKGAPALTVIQKEEALKGLKEKADEVGASLVVVKPLSAYLNAGDVISRMCTSYQAENASLAIALACEWERRQTKTTKFSISSKGRCDQMNKDYIPDKYKNQLLSFEWPGRAQILEDASCPAGCLQFYLDGAHTVESMEVCGKWFGDQNSLGNTRNILWFSCTGGRDHHALLAALLGKLHQKKCPIHHAVFAPLNSSKSTFQPRGQTSSVDLRAPIAHHDSWKQITGELTPKPVPPRPCPNIPSVPTSLSAALHSLRKAAKENPRQPLRVLVTGSLYLVGDVLKLLQQPDPRPRT